MLNYNHLYYFYCLCHSESLADAGQKLGVKKSCVSIQMKRLEKSLGHFLFEKSGTDRRKIKLTDKGDELLVMCKNIFCDSTEKQILDWRNV